MNNFTKSIVYSGVVLAAGLVAIFAIYNNMSADSAGNVSYIEPAAGVEGSIEDEAAATAAAVDMDEQTAMHHEKATEETPAEEAAEAAEAAEEMATDAEHAADAATEAASEAEAAAAEAKDAADEAEAETHAEEHTEENKEKAAY